MPLLKRLPIVILALSGLSIANASVVDFNSFSPTDTCLTTVSAQGLDFTNNGGTCLGVWTGSPNGNGTPDLIFAFAGYTAITLTGGGAFDLNDFDMAISWYSAATSTTVDVTADFAAGGSSMQVLTLSTTEQPFTLNLANVTEVDVTAMASGDGYWEMDNVDYTAGAAVPEPANLGVAGAMLIAIAAASRFRRRAGRIAVSSTPLQ